MKRARPGAKAGFTLFEALLVLVIMSLAAVVAAPALMRPAGAQLRADASRLASALRVTRSAAMARGSELTFALDRETRSYASPVIAATGIDPRIEIDLVASALEQARPRDAIRFFPSGRSTGADIRLRLGGAETRISVSWATGHVLVRE